MIEVSSVACTPEQEALVLEVMRSGRLVQGSMVERLEEHCRAMTGARHAIAVNSGTAALEVALAAAGVGPGDEVVTSPFTFVATLNAALHAGATVRFADIGPSDFNVDPELLDDAVSDQTKVVLPVHLYGQAADLAPIEATASRVGAVVVEDAAQAHGATYAGAPIGTAGAATFSFYATKNVQTGEGGVVTTDDDEMADTMRIIRNQGMRARYDYAMPGRNLRMLDLVAALALPQFDRLDETIAARRHNAASLSERLAGLDGLVLPTEAAGRGHVWHQFTVRVTPEARLDRDALSDALRERGVGSGAYYPHAVYDYDCFRDHPRVEVGDGCPVAETVASEVLSLPVHPGLTEADLDTIAGAVTECLS